MGQIFFYSFGGSLATLLRAVSDCGLGPCKQAWGLQLKTLYTLCFLKKIIYLQWSFSFHFAGI